MSTPTPESPLSALVAELEWARGALRADAALAPSQAESEAHEGYAALMDRAARVLREIEALLVTERRRNEVLIADYPGYGPSDIGVRSIAAARLGLIDAIERGMKESGE